MLMWERYPVQWDLSQTIIITSQMLIRRVSNQYHMCLKNSISYISDHIVIICNFLVSICVEAGQASLFVS